MTFAGVRNLHGCPMRIILQDTQFLSFLCEYSLEKSGLILLVCFSNGKSEHRSCNVRGDPTGGMGTLRE